ncbi:MAG: DUF6687 family protein [Bacteroidota bacterium]
MEFIPFQEAGKEENVIVVDAYLPGKLNLSHWRGVELPFYLQADTSTEIVLNALLSDQIDLKNYNCCTNNHFDIDGFLGVWALQNPELAIANFPLLAQMARIGDFRELDLNSPIFDQALSLVCYINQQEKELFYPPFAMNNQEDIACVPKYEYFLNEFANYIQNREVIESDEYLLVRSQLADLKEQGTQTFYPNIRLLVLESPYPMHYYPLFAKSDQMDMVLTIYPDNRYELESKYTTWVQTIRKSFPRILLEHLANELNQVETSGNKWKGDHFTDTGPILRIENGSLSKEERFDNPMNRTIHSSSIDKKELIALIVDYLKGKYQNVSPQINWSWEQLRAFNG